MEEKEIDQTYDVQAMLSMYAWVMMIGSHAGQVLGSLTIERCDPAWKMALA